MKEGFRRVTERESIRNYNCILKFSHTQIFVTLIYSINDIASQTENDDMYSSNYYLGTQQAAH